MDTARALPAATPEEMQEKLELANASTELMRLRAGREMKVLTIMEDGRGQLSSPKRPFALKSLWALARHLKFSQADCFRAAAQLDVWLAACAPSAEESFFRQLPATCLAVLRILHKSDFRMRSHYDDWTTSAEPMVGAVRQLGHDIPDVTEEDVAAQERSILSGFHWQIDIPSVTSWVSMLTVRFNALTEKLFVDSLHGIGNKTCFLALTLVLWRPADGQLRPRRLASGLFGLGLVLAGLLALDRLRPEYMTREDWEQLFQDSHMMDEIPPCTLQPRVAQRVLEVATVATDLPLEDLQKDCEFTMSCLRAAVIGAQRLRHTSRLA